MPKVLSSESVNLLTEYYLNAAFQTIVGCLYKYGYAIFDTLILATDLQIGNFRIVGTACSYSDYHIVLSNGLVCWCLFGESNVNSHKRQQRTMDLEIPVYFLNIEGI